MHAQVLVVSGGAAPLAGLDNPLSVVRIPYACSATPPQVRAASCTENRSFDDRIINHISISKSCSFAHIYLNADHLCQTGSGNTDC